MKSYKYKTGDIVNGWRILYKYTDKYKWRNGEKNYAYRVQCVLCGEERDLYGVAELNKRCACKKAVRTLNRLKKEYSGKVFDNIKIVNFFYDKEKGILCVYKDPMTNRLHKRAFYKQTIEGIKNEFKQEFRSSALTVFKKCEKILQDADFKINNISYHNIKELINAFHVTEYGCIKYIRKYDLEGLRLYALYTEHKYKVKDLKKII